MLYMSNKPNIANEMDEYIREQVDNGNYILIDINEVRKKYQLHFVGYNFIVSATSSSTKVRMTTDSSMRSKSGLSLNDVTKPAPGDVPSLRGILLISRCYIFYAVYDIKKFFRSVLTSDKDSYLQIVCVSHPPPSPLHLLQILPGYFTETEPFILEKVPPEIMLPVPRLLQLVHSCKILMPIFNLPSFKPSWKTPT